MRTVPVLVEEVSSAMMTVHVLHAGDGYTYLTRQVAAGDVARGRGNDLTAYYTASGNPPGRWVGEGLASLGVSGEVTEEQMRALFGEGRHPDADAIEKALIAGGATPKQAMAFTQLGRRFMLFDAGPDDGFKAALRAEHAAFRQEHDRDAHAGAEREFLRRAAAHKILSSTGKDVTPQDIGRYLAARGTAQRQPVAGYDLVFTPVKSVSVLWGLGDAQVRQAVQTAHEEAWRGALSWLESQAALTRVGAGGVAQIETHGLIATAFDHIDSRTGDPNLHTHVAVSNKVLGIDGKWRSLDGRVIHALGVSASEHYNSLIETGLRSRLGVQFVERATGRAGRRPVREIDGMPAELNEAFSARRHSIEAAYDKLVGEYRSRHGHEPPRPVQHKLAQQATLSTRQGKEAGVSQELCRAQWMHQAVTTLGSPAAVRATITGTLNRPAQVTEPMPTHAQLADEVLTAMMTSRSTWQYQHVLAEAQRVARRYVDHVGPDSVQPLAEVLTDHALRASLPLTPAERNPVPAALQRTDTVSVYVQHAGARYTANPILDAEDRLVASAKRTAGLVVPDQTVTAKLAEQAKDRPLDAGQADMVREFATSGKLLQVAIGPAGAGKTTAMRVFTHAVQEAGGQVVAIGPSATAAVLLGREIGVQGYSMHAFLARAGIDPNDAKLLRGPFPADTKDLIGPGTVVLVDEAGMASTPHLDAVVRYAAQRGASVRAVGDWAQLQAVGAGGAMRLIADQVGGPELTEVHRFTNPAEAAASLRLRTGDLSVIDSFYAANGRLTGGTVEAMTEEVYARWWADVVAGRDSIMVAQSNDDVAALAARARTDLVSAGHVRPGGVQLHDANTAGVGDRIVTRRNDTDLRLRNGTDWVRNGSTWIVTDVHPDGSLRARATDGGGKVDLPADYVAEHVDLAYATTVNRAQGITVDASYVLVTDRMGRDGLYSAMTRGREDNQAFVVVDELVDLNPHPQTVPERAIRQALASVLNAHDDTPAATAVAVAEADRVASLETLHPAYEDALERVLDPGREDRLAQKVSAALPEYAAETILADPAWPTLRQTLAAHEATGTNIEHLVAQSFAQREIDSAESLARVMWWRVGAPAATEPADPRLPAWVSPAPDPDTAIDPEVARWAQRQIDLMVERIDKMVDRVAEHPPTWARNLQPAPADRSTKRGSWDYDMRTVVAYRDRWNVTDETTAIPTDEAAGIQETARTVAAAAADRLAAQTPNPLAGKDAERAALVEETTAAIAKARAAANAARTVTDKLDHPGTTPTDERLAALRRARGRAENPELDQLRTRLRAITGDKDEPGSQSEDIRALAAQAEQIRREQQQQQAGRSTQPAHVDRYERPPAPAPAPVRAPIIRR